MQRWRGRDWHRVARGPPSSRAQVRLRRHPSMMPPRSPPRSASWPASASSARRRLIPSFPEQPHDPVRNPSTLAVTSLAEMTQAINILPNPTPFAQIGLFRFEGVSQRSVIEHTKASSACCLPSRSAAQPPSEPRGPVHAALRCRGSRHDDVVLPADIRDSPRCAFDAADPLVEVMNRKPLPMRRKHAQTREYMEMNRLRGIVKRWGRDDSLQLLYTEFGPAQISVDFVWAPQAPTCRARCARCCAPSRTICWAKP